MINIKNNNKKIQSYQNYKNAYFKSQEFNRERLHKMINKGIKNNNNQNILYMDLIIKNVKKD